MGLNLGSETLPGAPHATPATAVTARTATPRAAVGLTSVTQPGAVPHGSAVYGPFASSTSLATLSHGSSSPPPAVWAWVARRLRLALRESPVHVGIPTIEEAVAVLSRLVRSDFPTPQIAHDEEGGLEVVWLVNGQWLTLHVNADGEGEIWAHTPRCEIFSGPVRVEGEIDERLLNTARNYLAYLAPEVRHWARAVG